MLSAGGTVSSRTLLIQEESEFSAGYFHQTTLTKRSKAFIRVRSLNAALSRLKILPQENRLNPHVDLQAPNALRSQAPSSIKL